MPEVVIKSDTPAEDPKHVEAMLAKAEGKETPPPAPATDAKPEWLGDFESPEEMAKAYQELRSKMSKDGAPKQEAAEGTETTAEGSTENPEREAAEQAAESAGLDMPALEKEFADNGDLSEETYEKLAKAGIDKAMVDAYVAGQQAIADASQARIEAHVGGAETLQSMLDWAATNLSAEEKQAFNNTVDNADEAGLKLAMDGLKAKYIASEGDEPKLLGGSSKGNSGAVFRSNAELTQAMRDPRYGKDPAYRADVEAKLARSSIF